MPTVVFLHMKRLGKIVFIMLLFDFPNSSMRLILQL